MLSAPALHRFAKTTARRAGSTWMGALLGLSLASPGLAQPLQQTEASEMARKDLVGSLLPLPLGSTSERQRLRELYAGLLSDGGRSFVPLSLVTDPLFEFKQTGDRRTIPDPRAGGRGNNANDRLTNCLLGWLLYGERNSLEQGLLVAEWLAGAPEYQDQGHVQRHPSLALAAIASPDPGQQQRLISGFLGSLSRLQGSRFWGERDDWSIGLAGIRPFLRSVGAAHRFVYFLRALRVRNLVTEEQIAAHQLPFSDPEQWLDRVQERFREFCTWRKTLGDQAPRGWQTEAGQWSYGDPITHWPYLDSRDPAGRDSTWFHYGQIFLYECLSVKLFYPDRFENLFELRAQEVAEWSLLIGTDLLGSNPTGMNVRSRRNWFYPTNPQFGRPFRQWTTGEKTQWGESVYCLLPSLSFVRGFDRLRDEVAQVHTRTSSFSNFEGEVNCAALMSVWIADLQDGE